MTSVFKSFFVAVDYAIRLRLRWTRCAAWPSWSAITGR